MIEQQDGVQILQELGDGLIVRRARVADAAQLATFNATIHGDPTHQEPDNGVAAWTLDLMGGHLTFRADDFLLVEDSRAGRIVSSLNLISQRWSYSGIDFKVGQVELVGTDPAYRGRALVRCQMELLHRISAERGELVQAIEGIPNYYRQFGYEMALEVSGGRLLAVSDIPTSKEGEEEAFRLRPATPGALPFISRLYEQAASRYLVSCLRHEPLWRYELDGRSAENLLRQEVRLIETAEGVPIGFLSYFPRLRGTSLRVNYLELDQGSTWFDLLPALLRALQRAGEEGPGGEFRHLFFALSTAHPLYPLLDRYSARTRPPYAWYLRVADLPAFLQRVAPVLERRLADSPFAGRSTELRLGFYRSGLRLILEQGRLVTVEPWHPQDKRYGDLVFPGLTFLQLLFGFRSFDELAYAFPDCGSASEEARVLVDILFPRQPSHLWPIS